MQIRRWSDVATELLADEEATAKAAAKKAKKKQQQNVKKQQVKQQHQQQKQQDLEGSSLQRAESEPSPPEDTPQLPAVLTAVAGVAHPSSHQQPQMMSVQSQPVMSRSGSERGMETNGEAALNKIDSSLLQHDVSNAVDIAEGTTEEQHGRTDFMHQLLCCPISKVRRTLCWQPPVLTHSCLAQTCIIDCTI